MVGGEGSTKTAVQSNRYGPVPDQFLGKPKRSVRWDGTSKKITRFDRQCKDSIKMVDLFSPRRRRSQGSQNPCCVTLFNCL